MRIWILVFVMAILALGCKEESVSTTLGMPDWAAKEQQATAAKANEERSKLLYEIYEKGASLPLAERLKHDKLGAALSKKFGDEAAAIPFIKELIFYSPDDAENADRMGDLVKYYEGKGEKEKVDMLAASLQAFYPNAAATKTYGKKTALSLPQIDTMMRKYGEQMLLTPTNDANFASMRKIVDLSTWMGMLQHDTDRSIYFLLNASSLAHGAQLYEQKRQILDQILQKYPKHPQAAIVQFDKAFLLENNFKQKQEAVKEYELFLSKYPDHALASQAKVLLENLRKESKEAN